MSQEQKLAEIHRLGEALVKIGESLKQIEEPPTPAYGAYSLYIGLRDTRPDGALAESIHWYEYPLAHSDRRVMEDLAEVLLRQNDILGIRIENFRTNNT